MVAPITYVPTERLEVLYPGSPYSVRVREISRVRQKRPFDRPLPYSVHTIEGVPTYVGYGYDGQPAYSAGFNFNSIWRAYVIPDETGGDSHLPWFQTRRNDVVGKALMRFNDKRGENASLGVTLAQANMTLGMISKRAEETLDLILALRRKDWKKVRRLLRPHKGWRKRTKGVADNYLEIYFGWMPFIVDMAKAVKVLDSDFPFGKVRGSASLEDTLEIGGAVYGVRHKARFRAAVEAQVRVTNPWLDTAGRLGLLNPIPVIYDITPWSFVVNWVINLDQFLAQGEFYPGVELKDPQWMEQVEDDMQVWKAPADGNPGLTGGSRGKSFRRSVGSLPSVSLKIRPNYRWDNLPRALSQVSLLIQKGIKER